MNKFLAGLSIIIATMMSLAIAVPAFAATKEVVAVIFANGEITITTASGKEANHDAMKVCRWAWLTVQDERFTISRMGDRVSIGGMLVEGLICPSVSKKSSASGGNANPNWVKNVDLNPGEVVKNDDTKNDKGESGTDKGNDSPDPDMPGKPPKVSG